MTQTTSLRPPATALRQPSGQAKREAVQPRRDPTAALAAIITGTATTTASIRAAGLTDAILTAHPLLTAAFAASVTAAMALAFTRHRALAALLLLTTTAVPWITPAALLR